METEGVRLLREISENLKIVVRFIERAEAAQRQMQEDIARQAREAAEALEKIRAFRESDEAEDLRREGRLDD